MFGTKFDNTITIGSQWFAHASQIEEGNFPDHLNLFACSAIDREKIK
jgi:hypothetical protein